MRSSAARIWSARCAAERKIGGFDAGDIGVANQFDGDGLVQRRGLRDEFANVLFGLSEIGFLAGIQLRATEREQQDDGFERVLQRVQLLQIRILQMRFVHAADAGNPGSFFLKLRDPILRAQCLRELVRHLWR